MVALLLFLFNFPNGKAHDIEFESTSVASVTERFKSSAKCLKGSFGLDDTFQILFFETNIFALKCLKYMLKEFLQLKMEKNTLERVSKSWKKENEAQ